MKDTVAYVIRLHFELHPRQLLEVTADRCIFATHSKSVWIVGKRAQRLDSEDVSYMSFVRRAYTISLITTVAFRVRIVRDETTGKLPTALKSSHRRDLENRNRIEVAFNLISRLKWVLVAFFKMLVFPNNVDIWNPAMLPLH